MTRTLILAAATCLSLTTSIMAQEASNTSIGVTLDRGVRTTPTANADAETSPVSTAPAEFSHLGTPDSVAPNSSATTSTAEAAADPQTTASSVGVAGDSGTSVTTPEGVVYQVLKPGTGPSETSTQTLLLHYTLYLTNGQKIESSRDAEFPVPLKLQRNTNSFIKGFEIGTEGMRVGEIRRIYIPAELGYGEKGNEVIPPHTPLIFETELVDLK